MCRGMTRSFLLLAAVLLPFSVAYAQEIEPADGTTISVAQVSGIDMDRLSPGLRADIGKLVGTPLDRHRLRDLAARIEEEQPRWVAALRITKEIDDTARVVFVVGRMRDQDRQANVNARYVVDEVEIVGIDEARLDQTLRDDLHALVGKPLDWDQDERLMTRLREALPDYTVARSIVRGGQPGQITLVFRVSRPESARWLRFEPVDSNALFHSDQGWGANLALGIGGDDFRVTPIIPIDNGDDLIEEYSGFGLRGESRKVGTERVGVFFEWSTYDQNWRDQTLLAMASRPDLPALYRNRMGVTPLLKFAFTPQLSVGGGVAITELDSLVEPGDYAVGSDRQQVVVSAMGGAIDGDAPMFERFAIGDTRTLRGWDKWAITPVGGNRLFATTLEFRYRAVGVFLDSGSVWDSGTENHLRFSTGVTFAPGPVFFTLAFPLNTDEFHAVFAMGLRLPVFGIHGR